MSVTTMKSTRPLRPLLIAAIVVAVRGAGLWFSGFRPGFGAQLVREPVSTIRVPAGMAVRLNMTVGLGTISVPASYWRQGDAVAVSPDYETAANRIELTVSSGIGNITIQQIGE